MLLMSGRSSAFGNVPEYGPVPPEITGDRRGEVGGHVEVDHLAVALDEGPHQLVAQAEVERERVALAPVVLQIAG